jgi:hypothetical protein
MLENSRNFSIEYGSEKSFGVVFSFVFCLIALYPLSKSQDLNIWALLIAFIFLILGYLAPKILTIPNKLWFKFGIFIGHIMTPILMALIYFIAVLPTGLIMRILGKDLLKTRLDKKAKSYWIIRDEKMGPMKNQF